ncbi:calcium-activated chloride channel-domain-containing protein [Gongronella butleri]|nr:calcium-activated chloride channel-domain-containing protein [Gongronella butleri]
MGSDSFAHLFPGMSSQTPETCDAGNLTPISFPPPVNQGVDYVIVFSYAVGKGKDDAVKLQDTAIQALKQLTGKLTRAGLYFDVKQGQTKGTLLVLVGCPYARLAKQYQNERVQDFLLGVKVDADDLTEATPLLQLTEAERLRLVYDILTLPFNQGGADVSPKVDPCVDSIFPLHNDEKNDKWISSWSKKWMITDDDLNQLRDTFGEKIAFYFAFLQSYLVWLAVPCVLGVLMHLTSKGSLVTWYAIGILAWGVAFTESWKRRQVDLAVQWQVRHCSKTERRRAAFKGDRTVRDQVTGEEMPFVPAWKIITRRGLSLPGVAIGALLLLFIVTFVFVLQLFLHEYYIGPFKAILHYAPTLGYSLLIPTMSTLYSDWVRVLTNWEMHKTESSWDSAYTKKIFIANFLVSYLSLFFIAWVYIPFGEHVLPLLSTMNISHQHQKVDFQRLRDQLVYFVVTGQVVGFLTEMVVPFVLARVLPKTKKVISKEKDREAADPFLKKIYAEAAKDEYNIYTDYVEMIIQFGYVSMFSLVWPWTALCCLLNNWVELRSDAVKICKYTRRPIPARAESIGPWLDNMETLVWLSSITMASVLYLFHPSTDIHSVYTPLYTLLAILLSEHVYVVIRFVVQAVFAAIPERSELAIKKSMYHLKQKWIDRAGGGNAALVRRLDASLPTDPLHQAWARAASTSVDDTNEQASQWIKNDFKVE